jgi:hypothetical protein
MAVKWVGFKMSANSSCLGEALQLNSGEISGPDEPTLIRFSVLVGQRRLIPCNTCLITTYPQEIQVDGCEAKTTRNFDESAF